MAKNYNLGQASQGKSHRASPTNKREECYFIEKKEEAGIGCFE